VPDASPLNRVDGVCIPTRSRTPTEQRLKRGQCDATFAADPHNQLHKQTKKARSSQGMYASFCTETGQQSVRNLRVLRIGSA
jgi:hypothetical protein